jgi:SulP family sulfate permease
VIFDFDVKTIGAIPKTLLLPERLTISDFKSLDFALIKGLLMPAASIAVLGMIESLLCGEVASRMKKASYNPNRDLISQGIGNVIIPFFGGVPATAAIARTSVGIKSGGQTRLVSVFHAVGLLLSMFLLAPVMSRIPLAALSGVLFVTAFRMNEWHAIKYMFSRKFKTGIAAFLLTMFATIIFDLTQAILIGVGFALVLFVIKLSNITVSVRGVNNDEDLKYVNIAYVTGPLFFSTVGQFKDEISEQCDNLGTAFECLILSMRGVSHIDMTGVQSIRSLIEELTDSGITLMLCSLQPDVESMLKRGGVLDEIGAENIFWSADKALLELRKL